MSESDWATRKAAELWPQRNQFTGKISQALREAEARGRTPDIQSLMDTCYADGIKEGMERAAKICDHKLEDGMADLIRALSAKDSKV